MLLELNRINKSFPGIHVLKDLSFSVNKGEIHSLCGENGAGKSTLIKVLAGVHTPDSGEIRIEGKTCEIEHPQEAKDLGISTVYQEHSLFQHLSILENIFTGQEYRKLGILVDRKKMHKKAQEMLDFFELNYSPNKIVGELGAAEQKIIEMIRGLIMKAKVLILDEPTASFGKEEIRMLLSVVKKLRSEGLGIIFISHHLEEVFEISDRITVIRDGEVINSYEAKDVNEQQVIRDMVGRDASQFYSREQVEPGEVILKVDNLCGNGVSDVSFELRAGEVLGIGGIAGAGRSELAEVLFGAKEKESGKIFFKGQEVNLKNPSDAIKKGMCLITEERKATGLFLDQSLINNTVLAQITNSGKFTVNPKKSAVVTYDYVKKLRVKASSIHQPISSLSGGNQQKVILGKWFFTEPTLYIFDEPTRGIDIGAKEDIYHIMVDLLKEGKAIIMISSDMPELTSLSDKILVMKKGRIGGQLNKEDISEHSVMELAV